MPARRSTPVAVICAGCACIWGCGNNTEVPGSGYEAELARIEHAKPEPGHPAMTAERVERLIRTGKWIKLRIGDASVYRPRHPKPPARIATAAVDGCDTFTFSDGTKVEIPYPPGVTAKRIGRWRVLVTYLAGDDREECHAEAVDFSADESADLLP